MVSAIIGASGDIASNLLLPLLSQMGQVNLVDKNSTDLEWEKVWGSDVIWLAVPRDEAENVVRGIHLSPNQLVIDVCSIKRRVSDLIKLTGAMHLSLHPLHGPHIPLKGQRWTIINASETANNQKALEILTFLRQQGISIFDCETEDMHDFMMGVTLSMPELLTIVMDRLISTYAEKCGMKKPNMNEMMAWAVPASNALFSVYVRVIVSSAPWLRRELLVGSFGDLVGVSKKVFEDLSVMSYVNVGNFLDRQQQLVEEMSSEERVRVNQWIENWYVDSTQKIFKMTKS